MRLKYMHFDHHRFTFALVLSTVQITMTSQPVQTHYENLSSHYNCLRIVDGLLYLKSFWSLTGATKSIDKLPEKKAFY